MGYDPVFLQYGDSPRRYLAEADNFRVERLSQAFSDPAFDAVWALRGGFGCVRTLDRLQTMPEPRVFVGFSDVTALHANLDFITFHGPVVTQLADVDDTSRQFAKAMLAGEIDRIPLSPDRVVRRDGVAEGHLVGGNLSVLASLVGTPYFPDLSDAVLFLEDVAEAPYRVDRMLTQLRLAGCLNGVRGVVLGRFTHVKPELATDFGPLFDELASWISGPVVDGLAVGHCSPNLTVPVGARVRLDSACDHLRLLEAVLE